MITSASGSGSLKKLPATELHPRLQPLIRHVLLEDRTDFRKIEPDAQKVRVFPRHLRQQIALRRPDVGHRLVLGPGKLRGDRLVGPAAHARHRLQKLFQPCRIGVDGFKYRRASALQFALRQSRTQSLRQIVPMPKQTVVGHLQNAADIRRLALVQKKFCRWSIRIDPVAPLEKSQRDQCIQKIPRRSRMQSQPPRQRLQILRVLCQLGKDFHLHRAQKRLRGPESQAGFRMCSGEGAGVAAGAAAGTVAVAVRLILTSLWSR